MKKCKNPICPKGGYFEPTQNPNQEYCCIECKLKAKELRDYNKKGRGKS